MSNITFLPNKLGIINNNVNIATTLENFFMKYFDNYKIGCTFEKQTEDISKGLIAPSNILYISKKYNCNFKKEYEIVKFKQFKLWNIIDDYMDYLDSKIKYYPICYDSNFKIGKEQISEIIENKEFDCYFDKIDCIIKTYKELISKNIPSLHFIKITNKSLENKYRVMNVFRYYRDLFINRDFITRYDKDIIYMLMNNFQDVVSGHLRFEDIIPYLYFTKRLKGISGLPKANYITINEYQDFNLDFFKFIKMLYPNAKYNLVGNAKHSINPFKFWVKEDLIEMFGTSTFIEEKNTYEIEEEEIYFESKLLLFRNLFVESLKLIDKGSVAIVTRFYEDIKNVKVYINKNFNNDLDKKQYNFIWKNKINRYDDKVNILSLFNLRGFENNFDYIFINVDDLKYDDVIYKILRKRVMKKLIKYTNRKKAL